MAVRRAGAMPVCVLASLAAFGVACSRQAPPPAPAPAPEPVAETPPPAPAPAARPAPPARSLSSIIDTVFLLTNRERVRASLTPLRRNADLARVAQLQAEQMAAAGKLAHEVPGSRYPTLTSRLEAVSYTMGAAGENIGEGYRTAAEATAGWTTLCFGMRRRAWRKPSKRAGFSS